MLRVDKIYINICLHIPPIIDLFGKGKMESQIYCQSVVEAYCGPLSWNG